MPDPFTPCPENNKDGVPCWLARGHTGLCEVHPMHRKDTDLPVWSRELDYSHLLDVEGA